MKSMAIQLLNTDKLVRSSLLKIQEYLEIALKERDADAKVQLIDLRDSLLDYLVSTSQNESRVHETMKK